MEDFRRLKQNGINRRDIADLVEYRELLKRFCIEEEQVNRRRLLFGDDVIIKPNHPDEDE